MLFARGIGEVAPQEVRGCFQLVVEQQVDSFEIPAERVVVQIVEADPENKAKGGALYRER